MATIFVLDDGIVLAENDIIRAKTITDRITPYPPKQTVYVVIYGYGDGDVVERKGYRKRGGKSVRINFDPNNATTLEKAVLEARKELGLDENRIQYIFVVGTTYITSVA